MRNEPKIGRAQPQGGFVPREARRQRAELLHLGLTLHQCLRLYGHLCLHLCLRLCFRQCSASIVFALVLAVAKGWRHLGGCFKGGGGGGGGGNPAREG